MHLTIPSEPCHIIKHGKATTYRIDIDLNIDALYY